MDELLTPLRAQLDKILHDINAEPYLLHNSIRNNLSDFRRHLNKNSIDYPNTLPFIKIGEECIRKGEESRRNGDSDNATKLFSIASEIFYLNNILRRCINEAEPVNQELLDDWSGPLRFKGILLSYSKAPNNITLQWAAATPDDGNLQYNVYISQSKQMPRNIDSEEHRVKVTYWSGNLDISGELLKLNTLYYCKVMAINEKGVKSRNSRITEVQTPQSDLHLTNEEFYNKNEIVKEVTEKSLEEIIYYGEIGSTVFLPSLKDGGICPTGSGSKVVDNWSDDDGYTITESLDSSPHNKETMKALYGLGQMLHLITL